MSQNGAILEMLFRGEKVTPLTAFKRCGTLALHSRCAELRERGFDVRCEVQFGKGHKKNGVYRLVK